MKAIFRFYSAQSRSIVGDIECEHKSIEERRLLHAGYGSVLVAAGETWETAPRFGKQTTPNRLETDADFARVQLLASDTGAPAVPRNVLDELEYRLMAATIESNGGEDYGSLYYFYYLSWDKLLKVEYRGGSAIKGADSVHFYERLDAMGSWQHLASAAPKDEADLNAVYDEVFRTSVMPAKWQWKPNGTEL
jgi:hypothetical protein